jgi:hypothetical protein
MNLVAKFATRFVSIESTTYIVTPEGRMLAPATFAGMAAAGGGGVARGQLQSDDGG